MLPPQKKSAGEENGGEKKRGGARPRRYKKTERSTKHKDSLASTHILKWIRNIYVQVSVNP